ncbi:periplasmic protein TonB [Gammaproteobacteria bacterium]
MRSIVGFGSEGWYGKPPSDTTHRRWFGLAGGLAFALHVAVLSGWNPGFPEQPSHRFTRWLPVEIVFSPPSSLTSPALTSLAPSSLPVSIAPSTERPTVSIRPPKPPARIRLQRAASVPQSAKRPPATFLSATAVSPGNVQAMPESPPPAILAPPRYQADHLHNPPPTYPLLARRRGIEGLVRVRAEVDPDGHCRRVELARGSGEASLDDAAVRAIQRWRFIPARRGHEAVSAWVDIPLRFRLTD